MTAALDKIFKPLDLDAYKKAVPSDPPTFADDALQNVQFSGKDNRGYTITSEQTCKEIDSYFYSPLGIMPIDQPTYEREGDQLTITWQFEGQNFRNAKERLGRVTCTDTNPDDGQELEQSDGIIDYEQKIYTWKFKCPEDQRRKFTFNVEKRSGWQAIITTMINPPSNEIAGGEPRHQCFVRYPIKWSQNEWFFIADGRPKSEYLWQHGPAGATRYIFWEVIDGERHVLQGPATTNVYHTDGEEILGVHEFGVTMINPVDGSTSESTWGRLDFAPHD
jgi:hypothetical protein